MKYAITSMTALGKSLGLISEAPPDLSLITDASERARGGRLSAAALGFVSPSCNQADQLKKSKINIQKLCGDAALI